MSKLLGNGDRKFQEISMIKARIKLLKKYIIEIKLKSSFHTNSWVDTSIKKTIGEQVHTLKRPQNIFVGG